MNQYDAEPNIPVPNVTSPFNTDDKCPDTDSNPGSPEQECQCKQESGEKHLMEQTKSIAYIR